MILTIILASIISNTTYHSVQQHILCSKSLIDPKYSSKIGIPLIFAIFTTQTNQIEFRIEKFSLFVWNRNPDTKHNTNNKEENFLDQTNKVHDSLSTLSDFGTSQMYWFNSTDIHLPDSSKDQRTKIMFSENVMRFEEGETTRQKSYLYSNLLIGDFIEEFIIKFTFMENGEGIEDILFIKLEHDGTRNYKRVDHGNCFVVEDETKYNEILQNLKSISETKTIEYKDKEQNDDGILQHLKVTVIDDLENILNPEIPFEIKFYDEEKEMDIKIIEPLEKKIQSDTESRLRKEFIFLTIFLGSLLLIYITLLVFAIQAIK